MKKQNQVAIVPPVKLKRVRKKRELSKVQLAADDFSETVDKVAGAVKAVGKFYQTHVEPHVKRIKGGK
jgi:hypothetical protein